MKVKKKKKHKSVSGGEKRANTESPKVNEGSRRHEKALSNSDDVGAKKDMRNRKLVDDCDLGNTAHKLKKKDEIMGDLLAFRDGEEYDKSLGKAWKRVYMLYEAPGRGKIADMANLMSYSNYNLELTPIRKIWELKKMLLATNSKSIIDIKDIDCSLDPMREKEDKGDLRNAEITRKKKKNAITLSGLLYLIDVLWSACGQEENMVCCCCCVCSISNVEREWGKLQRELEKRDGSSNVVNFFVRTYNERKELIKVSVTDPSHNLFFYDSKFPT
ncbi:unnamed protein product [Eruca vesicaria subsp. sativa]|uniref:Uncharacterized protein n=1 Tax=Eruca vesicaria subsp. sativa TaxID=29727 RepID=A0ABC8KB45_ERUVS|nr:unnamed protein product [Eruca vesicaria subsp. sativa]